MNAGKLLYDLWQARFKADATLVQKASTLYTSGDEIKSVPPFVVFAAELAEPLHQFGDEYERWRVRMECHCRDTSRAKLDTIIGEVRRVYDEATFQDANASITSVLSGQDVLRREDETGVLWVSTLTFDAFVSSLTD